MLVRMRENDHPHLVFPIGSGAPVVTPPEDELRITRVFSQRDPYHDDSTYEGLKEILRETDRRARAQGAKAVFVYPQFDHEVPRRDAWMVDELFHEQGLTSWIPTSGSSRCRGIRIRMGRRRGGSRRRSSRR